MTKQTKERCTACGKPRVIRRRLTMTLGKELSLLVVENVPVVACPSCGGSHMSAETLYEVERLKRHRRSLAKTRSVETVRFV